MATSTENSFIKLTETQAGRVGVRLQVNQFAKDSANFYGKVERFTLSAQNVLDGIADALPLIDTGTAAGVLNAYANIVLKALGAGNAVKFGELGVFYIASKGTVEKDGEKPELTVKFTASKALRNAVQNVEISTSAYSAVSGKITFVTDVTTGKTDGTITSGGSAWVEGSGIKVTGDDSGIWIAPVAENNSPVADESKWLKTEGDPVCNTPTKLLFALPLLESGANYRIVLRTRCTGRSGYVRKAVTEIISEIVTAA